MRNIFITVITVVCVCIAAFIYITARTEAPAHAQTSVYMTDVLKLGSKMATSLSDDTTGANWTTQSLIEGYAIKRYVAGRVAATVALIPTNNNTLSNGAGYITASSASALTNKSGNISMWTNDIGYITGITNAQVVSALAYTPTPTTRNLTINGSTQSLASDRTWTLTTATVAESGNLYYTDTRSRAAVSLTTTGTGVATYNPATGVLNIPAPNSYKIPVPYSGITNGSGDYTVTFPVSYSVAPNIQANIVGGTDLQRSTITTITTTGFTVHVVVQNTTTVALVGLVLIPGTAAVVGAKVDVLITEK